MTLDFTMTMKLKPKRSAVEFNAFHNSIEKVLRLCSQQFFNQARVPKIGAKGQT